MPKYLIRYLWGLVAVVAVVGTGMASYLLADSRSAGRGEERIRAAVVACDRGNVDRGLRLLEARQDSAQRFTLTLAVSPVLDCETTHEKEDGHSVRLTQQATDAYLRILAGGIVPKVTAGAVVALPPGQLP